MSDIANEELTAAVTRLFAAETAAHGAPVDGRAGSAYDRQQSGMFSVLYMASMPGPDNADEQLVHDALKSGPFAVFCAARSVIDATWREGMGLPPICDTAAARRLALPESSYADHVANGLI